jgi:hypothetical protein
MFILTNLGLVRSKTIANFAAQINFLNCIDPTYLSSYANYTKKVNALAEANRLRWRMGKVEKPQGYSHENI